MSSYYFDNDVNDYDDELKDLIDEHVFKEIRLSLPNKYRLMELDTILMPVENRRLVIRTRKLLSSRNFLLSGKMLFIGELVPEVDTADAIILQAFSGRALRLFLDRLHSADNAEIRSVYDIDASLYKSSLATKTISSESAVPENEPWYSWFTEKDHLLIVLSASAGLCLIAGLATVVVTARRNQRRNQRNMRHRRS
jgi:hypothetical protein